MIGMILTAVIAALAAGSVIVLLVKTVQKARGQGCCGCSDCRAADCAGCGVKKEESADGRHDILS